MAAIRLAARTALVLASLVPVLGSGNALAQGLGVFSGGADPLAGATAGREAVLETLDASFVREQLVRLGRVRDRTGKAAVPFDVGGDLERARERYLAAASEALFALEGDGSLTFGEVADELPSIREEHIGRFEDVVEARSLGFEPPPLPEGSEGPRAYALEMARYILVERNPPRAWGRLALSAGIGVLIALGISWVIGRVSRSVAEREHAALASTLDAIRVPLVFAAAAAGLLSGLDVLWLPAGVEQVARTTLGIVVVALGFLAAWNLCDELAGILSRALGRATGWGASEHARRTIQRALSVLVVIAFLLVVSRALLDVSLTGLLTGLGILGVGLWFLARGLVENVAASFTLFGDRVFRIGDTIIHEGTWGVIEDIGFRSTRCRTFEGHLLHIPNGTLVDDTIRNVSARPHVRRRFRLSLVYDTSPDKIEEALGIVRAIVDEAGERVDSAQGVHAVFEGFGAHDLQLLVQYYSSSDDYWIAKGLFSDINVAIRRRFEEAGIAFAFPTQTTLLDTVDDEPVAIVVDGGSASSATPDREAADAGDDDPPARAASSGSTRREGIDEEGDSSGDADAAGGEGGEGR